MSGTTIVIVARDPRGAKRRLRTVLDPAARERLCRAMLADVIAACCGTGSPVLVVTESAAVARLARAGGAAVHRTAARGTRAAARVGIAVAAAQGASAVLVVPADLPLLQTADVRRVLATGDRDGVTVAGDRHRLGTNALLIRPPAAVPPRFGRASYLAHIAGAQKAGLRLRTPRIAGFGLDVDLPEDLRALRRRRSEAGRHTAALLRELV